MEKAWLSMFIATIAWSPIPGPSCLRTTTYNHHHCSLICRRKLQESRLIPDAWQKVLFQSLQLEQEEGVPVWRTLESYTRLGLSHGARRLLQIDTDPARLRSSNNKSEYAKYAKYAKYDLISCGHCTLPAQKHRHNHGTAYLCLSSYGF